MGDPPRAQRRRPRRWSDGSDGAGRADRRLRIGIVGGGASGTLLAARLLQAGWAGLEVVVVEPRATLGRGIAYGTDDAWHRLNVPAAGMSAYPDDPDHFRRWAGVRAEAFLPRRKYAAYLADVLAATRAGSPARLDHVRSAVAEIQPTVEGLVLELADGRSLVVDAAVLATGLDAPALPAALDGLPAARVIHDPWAPRALEAVRDGDTIAVLGTGLTAVDVAGTVLARHGATRVVAVSRRGLLPRRHEDPWRPRLPEPAFGLDVLASADPLAAAAARLRAHGSDWRRALDSVRPITQDLWLAMDEATRTRFLRDHRAAWDAGRHRMAAEVARALDGWAAAGRLEVAAGGLDRVVPTGAGLRLEAAPGPGGTRRAWDADRIVVATGPDPDAAANPLLEGLIDAGLARRGPAGIALDVAPETGRVIGRRAGLRLPLFAIGPLRRGVLWESVAMPEIREQAARLAGHLVGRVPV